MDKPAEELRILILEDEPSDAELEASELRDAGLVFTLLQVSTREAFMKALDEFKPDIVLADYKLPAYNGREALQYVRRIYPQIPVIMVTGTLGDVAAVELLMLGAKDYVLKDNLARLAPAIKRALSEERGIRNRKLAEEALRRSEGELKEAQRVAHLGSWQLDTATNAVVWTEELYRIFGFDPTLPLPMYQEHQRFLTPESWKRMDEAMSNAQKTGVPFELELETNAEVRRKGWLMIRGEPIRDEAGTITGLRGVALDITERKQADVALRRANSALKTLSAGNRALGRAASEDELLQDVTRIIVETGSYTLVAVYYAEDDPEKSITPMAWSGMGDDGKYPVRHRQYLTWADTEQGQLPISRAIRSGTTQICHDVVNDPAFKPLRDTMLMSGFASNIALPLCGGGRTFGGLNIYTANENAFDEREVQLLEELANDLSYGIETLRTRAAHEAAQSRLDFLAHHDPLTGLPNRLLLRDRFGQAAAIASHQKSIVALLYLDLDNFKQINDSLGHELGDKLLGDVVTRILSCIRETDTISRQGGDEFIVLLTNVRDVGTIEVIANNIVEAFDEPFSIDNHAINTSFSIGISLFPNDGEEFDNLLKKADTALYQAKDAGRNTFRFYTQQMNVDALDYLKLEGQLRNAIKQQEFLLHFQPQINTESGHVIGAEALVRWQHPELGLVPPDKFIPLSERSGLIIPLGEWVLNEACRQARVWWKTTSQSSMVIAVNLSALQFKRGDIVATVTNALERSGLLPGQLELELTESILLQDIEVVMKTLRQLKAIGVKISIDDFGTGYSSLSYLKRLAVDKLKIDKSFINDISEDADSAAIVKAMIQLGHTLQLTVIAEGVETDSQLAFLKNFGCDEIQGYLFSRPLPAEEFAAFLKR